MHEFDAKRFITWFLILSAITTPLVLILSTQPLTGSQSAKSATPETIPKNAFVEKVPESFGFRGSTVSFTDNLTSNLSTAIIEENPEGPQLDASGQFALALPTNLEDLAGQYTSGLSTANIEPTVDESRIQVLEHFTAADVSNYALKAQSALSEVFQDEIFQNAQSSPGDSVQALAMIDAFYFLYSRAEGELYSIPVPKPLVDINKRLIRFLDLQKSFFDQNDPARTVLAIRNSQAKLEAEWTEIQNAVTDIEKKLPDILSSLPDHNNIALTALRELFGISRAHASDFIGGGPNIVHSIFGTGGFFAKIWSNLQAVLEWVYKLLVEVLKDQIIHKLVQQVIDWVNGKGNPQFVTNWKGFLGDTFNNAIGGVIAKVLPGVCKPFQPLIKIAILPTNFSATPAKDLSSGCSLDKVIDNIEAFGKSFQNGGWLAYGATLKPSNNLLGSLIEINELALTEAAQKQEAAKNDATSGSGYKSKQTCTNPDTFPVNDIEGIDSVTATRTELKSLLGDQYESDDCDAMGLGCTEVTTCGTLEDENGDGAPPKRANTTPASVISGAANNAISGSPIGRIVNANDITALVSALVNAGLNKLIAAGVNAITGEDDGSGLTSLTPDATKGTVKNSRVGLDKTCAGIPPGVDRNACLEQNKGIVATEDSAGQSEKSNTVSLLKDFLNDKEKLFSILKSVIQIGNSVVSTLETVSTTCSAIAPQNPGVDPITLEVLPISATRDFITLNHRSVLLTLAKLTTMKTKLELQLVGPLPDIRVPPDTGPIVDRPFTYTAGEFKPDGTEYPTSTPPLTFRYPNLPQFITSTSTPSTAVEQHSEKDRGYFTKLSQDVNIQGSPFGRVFGTVAKLPADLANTEALGSSWSNAGCAILERSYFLLGQESDGSGDGGKTVEVNGDDVSTKCDIKIAKKVTDCH